MLDADFSYLQCYFKILILYRFGNILLGDFDRFKFGKNVKHHNKRYLMSARIILKYGAKELVKYKENNKKYTPYFSRIVRSGSSIFKCLTLLESLFDTQMLHKSQNIHKNMNCDLLSQIKNATTRLILG